MLSVEDNQIELKYDEQQRAFALSYNVSNDTINIKESSPRISYTHYSISLDSIRYIKIQKINSELTTAVIGGLAAIAVIVGILIYSANYHPLVTNM
jgi:hypothetical protein